MTLEGRGDERPRRARGNVGRRRFSVLALSALVAAGCGPERIPRPSTPAPTLFRPADALPADLDVVLRIDFRRIRTALGAEALSRLRRVAARSDDEATDRLVADALERADTVWIGLRPASSLELSDAVLVLRGKFRGLEPRHYASEPKWQAPVDLGAAWRRYDRAAPKLRSSPARIYVQESELMLFVSIAELDSVERALEHGERDKRLDPKEKGLISLEARVRRLVPVLEQRSPNAARLLGSARRLRLNAELDAAGLSGELELEFEEPEQAERTANAASLLARALASDTSLTGRVASALRIEAIERTLVVKAALSAEEFNALVNCADGARASCRDSVPP